MRLRMELFVDDLDTSIGFYAALGFAVERREHDYASLRWGDAVIGLGPVAKLPETGPGPGFTQERLAGARGAGIVRSRTSGFSPARFREGEWTRPEEVIYGGLPGAD